MMELEASPERTDWRLWVISLNFCASMLDMEYRRMKNVRSSVIISEKVAIQAGAPGLEDSDDFLGLLSLLIRKRLLGYGSL